MLKQQEPSRYIRTAWMLSAHTALKFSDGSEIRLLTEDEADLLAEQLQKRKVFARHSWENSFYVQRARALAGHTVIEVFRPGDPNEMAEEAEQIARTLERITVVSSTLALSKNQMQSKLGISAGSQTEIDLIVGPMFRLLRSRKRPAPVVQGIAVDKQFSARFSRCGFFGLVDYVQSRANMTSRVLRSVNWLFDSRIEPRLEASVVKTSIALESLLIFSESESLAQSLSERAAFILSSDPSRRQQISRTIKTFYDARSGIVHGSQKKAKRLTPSLLEAVDRLVVLLYLILASNADLWPSAEALRGWCETQRWGEPSSAVKIPFPEAYLRNAIRLSQKGSEPGPSDTD